MIALIIVSASVAVLLTVWALCRAAAAGDAIADRLSKSRSLKGGKEVVCDGSDVHRIRFSPDWSAWVCCRRSCTRPRRSSRWPPACCAVSSD